VAGPILFAAGGAIGRTTASPADDRRHAMCSMTQAVRAL
jgi:hypothetical protein